MGGVSWCDVDASALGSQRKAAAGRGAGHFSRSVVAGRDSSGQCVLDQNEFIKPSTTLEALGSLKPSFAKLGEMGMYAVCLAKYPQVAAINHVHTPGNSSGIVDGASAVLDRKSTRLNSGH